LPSPLILAPLRGVTIRCFRETFAEEIRLAGFTEAVTPFIAAMPGVDPLKDRELTPHPPSILLTPQFIGKDPQSLEFCLRRVVSAGYTTADLNCGCPFPMVRNKGRGSGILRTPDVLRRMLDAGCEVMGPGRFSIKVRLGVERTDELLSLLPLINAYPLRQITVHARTARQMYAGECDLQARAAVLAAAEIPVVINGDIPFPLPADLKDCPVMVGRGFVRYLGSRTDSRELLLRYMEASVRELKADRPVLGRMKELLAYWGADAATGSRYWVRRWNLIKVCRSLEELRMVI